MKKRFSISYKICMTFATWFGAGLLGKMPGTWGSLAAVGCAFIAKSLWPDTSIWVFIPIVFFLGWGVSHLLIKDDKENSDPGYIVIDEVAGQWIALIPASMDWRLWAIAFVAFRFFDILKPWPIHQSETVFEKYSWGKGFGIMIDDVLAGIYAALVVYVASFAF
jgi:phosphatidylglycerophosphatase A